MRSWQTMRHGFCALGGKVFLVSACGWSGQGQDWAQGAGRRAQGRIQHLMPCEMIRQTVIVETVVGVCRAPPSESTAAALPLHQPFQYSWTIFCFFLVLEVQPIGPLKIRSSYSVAMPAEGHGFSRQHVETHLAFLCHLQNTNLGNRTEHWLAFNLQLNINTQ